MAKKILIVEDEELLLNLLKKKLEELNYEVLIAKDGIAGLKAIKENEVDLILLDVVMPKMGGFELLEKMGEDETIKKVPVVIISNSGQPVEIEKAKRLGANDWLIKTEFDPQEVVDKVIKQIGESSE